MTIQRHNPAYRLTQNFLFLSFSVLFIAVKTTVGFCIFVRKLEDVGKSLLDGSDASRVFAVNHIGNAFWKFQALFFYYFIVANNIDGNVVINIT